jgi:hypothetical protein
MSSSNLQACLELCQFIHAFLKPILQNRRCLSFELAKVFHSWLSSEHYGVLLEIRNQNEDSCLWSLVATTSLDLAIISLPRCQTFLDTSLVMFVSSPFVWLMMTGVSTTLTKCASCYLCYHKSLPFWFHKWLQTLPSSFLPSSGRQGWPHTEVSFWL